MVFRVVLVSEMGTCYKGTAPVLLNDKQQVFQWTALFKPELPEKWEISGAGALIGTTGARVPDSKVAPFAIDGTVNNGFKSYLRVLLNQMKGLSPEKPVTENPTPVTSPPTISSLTPPSPVRSLTQQLKGVPSYSIREFGEKSCSGAVVSGQATIINPLQKIEFYPWTATHIGAGQWEIRGEGALQKNGERADPERFPFSLVPLVNKGFIESLSEWLNARYSNCPIEERASVTSPVTPVPSPVSNASVTVEVKDLSCLPDDVKRAIEAVSKEYKTSFEVLRAGKTWNDAEARWVLIYVLNKTLKHKPPFIQGIMGFGSPQGVYQSISQLNGKLGKDVTGDLKNRISRINKEIKGGEQEIESPPVPNTPASPPVTPATKEIVTTEPPPSMEKLMEVVWEVCGRAEPFTSFAKVTECVELGRQCGIFLACTELKLDVERLKAYFDVDEDRIVACVGKTMLMKNNGASSKISPILDAIKKKI